MEGTLEEVLECKFHIATRWMRLLQNGVTIPDYLRNQKINTIIIYGINDFTLSILEEYKIADRMDEIRAISDKIITDAKGFECYGISFVSPGDLNEYADEDTLVIITPMGWHREIRNELENQGIRHMLTIQELIYDMCFEMEDSKRYN